MSVRTATHAGTWYSANASQLSLQLTGYLEATRSQPIKGSRIIISPHAGYRYCGATMAHSYASLDLRSDKRLRFFILGPSHHFYFSDSVMISKFHGLDTPLGELSIDYKLCENLVGKHVGFQYMSEEDDEDEHSIEMQFPMLYQTLQYRNIDIENNVSVVPMLVSHNTDNMDDQISKILSDNFDDLNFENYIIISSDFCHWGKRFDYTAYVDSQEDLDDAMTQDNDIEILTSRSKLKHHQLAIWESIKLLDEKAMEVISKGIENNTAYEDWKMYLDITGNTICGQNPIKLVLKLLTQVRVNDFRTEWLNYSQSSHVNDVQESSVSYVSGCIKKNM